MPEWMAALPMVRLRLREDVIAAGERSGYQASPHHITSTCCTCHAYATHRPRVHHACTLQATPHLMLYVLHEPIAAEGDLPVVRRLLLTSANLSAAPWGYARGEQLGMGKSALARHCTRGHLPLQKPTCLREAALWGRQEGLRSLRIWDAKESLRCCSAQIGQFQYL